MEKKKGRPNHEEVDSGNRKMRDTPPIPNTHTGRGENKRNAPESNPTWLKKPPRTEKGAEIIGSRREGQAIKTPDAGNQGGTNNLIKAAL